MDPLSLLRAVLALSLFPGGLFFALATWLTATLGRIPGRRRASREEVVAIAAASAVTALTPYPGSPLADLPGAIAIPTLLVLLAAAVTWGCAPVWTGPRLVAALSAVIPLLCLAGQATTLSAPTVVGLPGRVITAARIFAALAALIAVFLVARPHATSTARWSRAAVVAAAVLLALSLVVSGLGGATAPVIAALLGLGGVTVFAALLGLLRGGAGVDDTVLAGAAVVPGLAAIILTVLG